MKTYFARQRCPQCSHAFDAIESTCPHCGHSDPSRRDLLGFQHQLRDTFPFQILYFLVGFAGYRVLQTVIVALVEVFFFATHVGASSAEATEFINQINVLFAIVGTSYVLLFIGLSLALFLRRKFPALFRSFASWQAGVAGFVGYLAIFGATVAYGFMTNIVLTAMGIPDPGVNANESTVRAITKAFPLLALIVLGVIGPFCEEVGYRVGLFGLSSRLGKPLGYILSALVFGFIHFDWEVFGNLSDGQALLRELINIPTYIGSGAALCFIYDRFGFGASFTAHSLNNIVSVLLTLVARE